MSKLTLRQSTLLLIGAALCCVTVVAYFMLCRGLSARFACFELRDGRREMRQALLGFADLQQRLDLICDDWAAWDDTYRFAVSRDQAYITLNLNPTALRTIGANYVIFARSDGTYLYGSGCDPSTGRAAPVPEGLRNALRTGDRLVRHKSPTSRVDGLLMLPEGPLLVASRPIITSLRRGPVRGALIVAARLDQRAVSDLARRADLALRVYPTTASADLESWPRELLASGDRIAVQARGADVTSAYGLVRDVFGKPGLVVQVDFPRVYYQYALVQLRLLLLVVVAFALGLGAGGLYYLEKRVLLRMERIGHDLDALAGEGTLSGRIASDEGYDELSRLARSINATLVSLEQAHDDSERSERRRIAVFEQASDGIGLIDCDRRVVLEANPELHRMVGLAPGTLTGRPLDEHLASLGSLLEVCTRSQDPLEVVSAELIHHRPDGSEVALEIRLSLLAEDGHRVVCVLARDMTERRQTEAQQARLEERLRQSQKLQALGQLAAGVAHNFNNSLAVIVSSLELAMLDAGERSSPHLDGALKAATRAAGMVKQFVLFSRRMPLEKRAINLRDLISDVAEMCRKTFDRRIEISAEFPPDLPPVLGDQSQLHGVLLNLCINSRDALEVSTDAGRPQRVKLSASPVVVGDGHLSHPDVNPGDYVRLTVADNGIGMDEATRRQVFDPFFTTKEIGKGTGLGLSTAYGVITEHGGWIDCRSQPGAGATFDVYLPVARLTVPIAELDDEQALPGATAGEHILVVDDEEPLRATLEAMLRRNGYQVTLAADGREGLAIFARDYDTIDLVILDLSMPRMSGWELMTAMLTINPRARIVLCSGYPLDPSERKGARALVAKPFECSELLQTLRQVIAEDVTPAPGPSLSAV